jgi:hypothetical protein
MVSPPTFNGGYHQKYQNKDAEFLTIAGPVILPLRVIQPFWRHRGKPKTMRFSYRKFESHSLRQIAGPQWQHFDFASEAEPKRYAAYLFP